MTSKSMSNMVLVHTLSSVIDCILSEVSNLTLTLVNLIIVISGLAAKPNHVQFTKFLLQSLVLFQAKSLIFRW